MSLFNSQAYFGGAIFIISERKFLVRSSPENVDKKRLSILHVDDTSGLSWGGQTYETDDGLVRRKGRCEFRGRFVGYRGSLDSVPVGVHDSHTLIILISSSSKRDLALGANQVDPVKKYLKVKRSALVLVYMSNQNSHGKILACNVV